tara:strand:+ start:4310 stop:4777 length:468 start_codon:yes stop_codon:yes gene_type:complete
MIYVLYGQPGSGKTTLANCLKEHLVKKIIQTAVYSPKIPVIVDGDEFRKIFTNTDYSKKGREDNIRAANAVATYISKADSKDVIMSLVNPYCNLRQELADTAPAIQILLETNRDLRKEYHVEDFERGSPDITINTNDSTEEAFNSLLLKLSNYIE